MVQDHAVEWDIIGAQRRGAPFFHSPPAAIAGALLFRGVCGVWRTPLVQGMKRWAGDLPPPLPTVSSLLSVYCKPPDTEIWCPVEHIAVQQQQHFFGLNPCGPKSKNYYIP